MPTQAINAHGTLMQLGAGSPVVYTTIAEVGAITGPALARTVIDVTNMDSQGWTESIAGLAAGGTVSFEVNYIPTDPTQDGSTGVLSVFETGDLTPFKIVFPNAAATSWTFNAFVKTYSVDAPVDGKLAVKIDLEISGQPTLA